MIVSVTGEAHTQAQVDEALDDGRLFVRVGHKDWFLANRKGPTRDLGDGDWLIQIHAGPHKAKGILTNIDDNREGRDFFIHRAAVIIPTVAA